MNDVVQQQVKLKKLFMLVFVIGAGGDYWNIGFVLNPA